MREKRVFRPSTRGIARTTLIIVLAVIVVVAAGIAAYYVFYVMPPPIKEIRIGIMYDEGTIHGINHKRGAEMAVEEINARGGILGAPVKLFFEDTDEVDPTIPVERGVEAVEKLITVHNVHVLVGGFRSDMVLAMQEVAMRYKIPFIVAGAGSPAITRKVLENYDKYKYTFRVTPVNSTALALCYIEFYKWLRIEYGFTKVYILGEDAVWARDLGEKVLKPYLPAMGYEIVGEDYVPLGTVDFTPELAKVIDSGAELIAIIFSGPLGVPFAIQWHDMAVPAIPVGINVMAQLEAFREMTGGKCDYITTLIDVSCLDNPIGRPFYRAYMEKYGESPIYIAPGTYLAVWAVAMAIEEAGTVDPDKIVEALERIDEWRDKLYEAMLYESAHVLRFDKSHDVVWGVYDPTKGFIAAFMQWQEGERKTVWPEAAKVADFMIPPHLKPASP